MNINPLRQAPEIGALHWEPLLKPLSLWAAGSGARRGAHDATARAAANVADWLTYLPETCVRAMVSDGWHWTT